MFVGDFEPGSPKWHAARAHGIGGSEIAAVLGLSPFESRFSLWHRKKGMVRPVEQNDVMYWGNLLEPVVRDEFNRRHRGDFLGEPGSFPAALPIGTWHAAGRPWQIANPDGVIHHWENMGGLSGRRWMLYEGKTAYSDDGWGEPGTDEIPVYYRTQVLWYLDVFGLKTCHVAVLISGSDYREYQVEYSADECELMRTKAAEFLDDLNSGKRPDIDAHSATYEVVRELHPDIADVKFDVPGHIAIPYLDAITAHKASAAEKLRTAAVLADAMGPARRAVFDGDQIAMRVAGRGPDSPPSLRATPSKKTTGQKVVAA